MTPADVTGGALREACGMLREQFSGGGCFHDDHHWLDLGRPMWSAPFDSAPCLCGAYTWAEYSKMRLSKGINEQLGLTPDLTITYPERGVYPRPFFLNADLDRSYLREVPGTPTSALGGRGQRPFRGIAEHEIPPEAYIRLGEVLRR